MSSSSSSSSSVSTTVLRKVQLLLLKPSLAWLYLFVPALSYFVSTRLHSLGLFRSSTYGDVVGTTVSILQGDCATLQKQSRTFLYLSADCQSLRYPFYKVLHDKTESIVATTWQEDQELGRGFLLLSSKTNQGRIYQWETGGGPIAIGRTLHLQDSGCRSNTYRTCSSSSGSSESDNYNDFLGSGGIAVDATNPESPRLVVAEYGEGRISRLEENGARTPLVIQVTKRGQGEESTHRRLCDPVQLLVTPHKDLMILERTTFACGNNDDIDYGYILWRLPKVTDIPALPSLAVSRRAHEWISLNNVTLPTPFFFSNKMGGMAIDSSGHRLLVTTVDTETNSMLVISLPLSSDDEDGERSFAIPQSQLVLDYSAYSKEPGAIATDSNGNIYLAVQNGILIVSKSQDVMVKIDMPNLEGVVVGLTVGSDKFLYMALEHTLLRFRIPSSVLLFDKEKLRKNLNVI